MRTNKKRPGNKPGAKKPLREWELYRNASGDLSFYSWDYSRGTHPYHLDVLAVSGRQAKFYAHNNMWSEGEGKGGIVRIYDRWNGDRFGPDDPGSHHRPMTADCGVEAG